MKKLLVVAALAMSAFGFAGAHAGNPDCSGPASLGPCDYKSGTDTKTCATLWVEGSGAITGNGSDCVA